MRFGFDTLKRTICALLVGLVLVAGAAVPAEAQRRGRDGRWWDGRHDNGRHLGWTRGRHRGWSNRDRDDDDRRRRRRAIRRARREDRREWRQDRREWRRQWRRDNFRRSLF